MRISCQLLDLDTVILKSFLEVSDNFSHKGLHRCDVDDLETLGIDASIGLAALSDCLEDGQHRDVGLTGSCWGADEQVLRGVESRLV